jgi:hypothetical protein
MSRRLVGASLAGLIGVGLLLPPAAECAGPAIGNRGTQGGRGASGSAALLAGRGSARGSGQRSGPMTFGYWDGSRFVRSPGPWVAPETGSRPARPRLSR